MSDCLKKAKDELAKGHTLAVCKGSELLVSDLRGVRPLLELWHSGAELSGASAADKVVGKGAALLYALLGVKEIYAAVVSDAALATLNAYCISAEYGERVPRILNRAGTGYCPVESAVLSIDNADEAPAAIEKALNEINAGK